MEQPVVTEQECLGAVPVLIVRPRGAGSHPLIVALYGLTGNKETMLPLIGPLAAAGYVIVAPDARYHGTRHDPRWAEFLANNETVAVSQAVLETAAELPAVLDAMAARPYVRADVSDGAGIIGVSMGALILYAAIPQEPRFTVAVSLIGGGTWGAELHERFAALSPDAEQALRARDPAYHRNAFTRVALLLMAGECDTVLPARTTQALYDALLPHVPDAQRLRLVIEPGMDHTVTMTMGAEAVTWFRRWLR